MFGQTGYSLADIAAATGNGRSNGDNGWGDNGAWWIIILFLFAAMGRGNGFFGDGNSQGSGTVREEVSYGFDMNGLENGIRGIQQGLCDGFYAMNTGMLNGFSGIQSTLCQGFSGVNNSITTSGYDTLQAIHDNTVANMQNTNALTAQLNTMAASNAACCCDIQRQIEKCCCDMGYNLATQSCDTRRAIADSTRDIIDSNNAGVRSILDFLTQDKIASLTAENQSLKFAASQANQNVALGAMMDANTAEILRRTAPLPTPAYVVPNPNCCYGGYYSYDRYGCGGCCN